MKLMNAHLISLANSIYGEAIGAALTKRLEEMLARWQPQIRNFQGPRQPLPLSQRDSMLITYADQLRATGEVPLQTLARFLHAHTGGVLSAVHLLPFYPWSSDDGFSVQDYYAVGHEFGDWPEVAEVAGHFDLMFDAVFNHMSAQSEWFRDFLAGKPERADFFVTVEGDPDLSRVVRPRALPLLTEFASTDGPKRVWTTFSADQVDVNVANPDVLLALTDALLFYVNKGARFLRLDAIAYLWKTIGTTCIHLPQTHAVIQLWRAVLDEIAPQVMLITETNVPHRDNLSYFGDGANEAQLVYNFALPPLVLHTLQTGDATRLSEWAEALDLPSNAVTFFNFLASHDGVGVNPARGILEPAEIDALVQRTCDRGGFVSMKNNPDGTQSPYEMNINYFDALIDANSGERLAIEVARFLCAQSIMLTLRGVPGIYFHSLFGSRGDRAAADASGIPRRINREKLSADALEDELADPLSRRAKVFHGFRQMLTTRAAVAAFSPSAAQTILDADAHCFALLREAADNRVLCLHNVTGEPHTITLLLHGNMSANTAADLLQAAPEIRIANGRAEIPLAPYEFRWLELA
jgi:sucrose phosphorylase